MSGHSKWSTIKHKKGAKDAQRGKLFAKLLKAVEVAAKEGGGDPTGNATLANAIDKAKAASVPNDNIERAIKRGTGEVEGLSYEELWYEGYGPGGVALLLQILTDNRNRAASDVRSTFSRNGGNLGEPGSVSYLFEQKGYVVAKGDEEDIMLAALDAGAEDIRPSDGGFEVISEPSVFGAVRAAVSGVATEVETAEITHLPKSVVPIDRATAPKILRLVDALEDLDDVQEVFANFDIPDEVMADLMG